MALDMGGFSEAGLPVRTDPATRQDFFLDMRAAGASQFSVSKAGKLNLVAGSSGSPTLSFPGGVAGIYSPTTNAIGIVTPGAGEIIRFSNGGNFNVASTAGIQWGASLTTVDLALVRDAASILGLRSTTNPQTWRIYNTYTDASNYERLSTVAAAGADFKIIPEALGTGTLQGLQLGVSGGKLGFYGTTAVTKPTALTASDGTLANAVIRQGELEAKLQSLGLLT